MEKSSLIHSLRMSEKNEKTRTAAVDPQHLKVEVAD